MVETSAAKRDALAYVRGKGGCDVLIIDTPGDRGGLGVCPLALQTQAAYQRSIAQGQGVGEYEPGGKADAEIAGLQDYVQAKTEGEDRERAAND